MKAMNLFVPLLIMGNIFNGVNKPVSMVAGQVQNPLGCTTSTVVGSEKCCGACYGGILSNYHCCGTYTTCILTSSKDTCQTAYFACAKECEKSLKVSCLEPIQWAKSECEAFLL